MRLEWLLILMDMCRGIPLLIHRGICRLKPTGNKQGNFRGIGGEFEGNSNPPHTPPVLVLSSFKPMSVKGFKGLKPLNPLHRMRAFGDRRQGNRRGIGRGISDPAQEGNSEGSTAYGV